MNTRTLTSANAILMLSVTKIFAIPQRIQGFATDDITDMDAVNPSETSMGIDGRLSAGYVPVPAVQNITLQADSESVDFFEAWAEYERSTREKLIATGSLVLPSTQKSYAMTRGFLTSVPLIPSLKKTLQPRRYAVTWQSVAPAPRF